MLQAVQGMRLDIDACKGWVWSVVMHKGRAAGAHPGARFPPAVVFRRVSPMRVPSCHVSLPGQGERGSGFEAHLPTPAP